ncbi:FAD-dependent oxidoreductase [Brevibacillus invocatus]|uniref:FAD-dependent oxidoreductase n=1 Tax=Brevibacillus invocatus TaxID=173959 RepID=UPI0023EA4CF4|nr:FAD-dependent oxidoreductase [Brevibacillus invocatus]
MKYDTIIIGGGIAGLQTAIQLSRCLRKVIVVDLPGGRSSVAKGYRNILGHPDRISGETLRQVGMKQAKQYGAVFKEEEVIKVVPCEAKGFQVWMKEEEAPLHAHTLVMATGIRDPFPDFPGVRECLGTSVFLCPDCDGYESVNTYTAIIGEGQHALKMTRDLSYFTPRMLVINHTGSNLTPAQVAELPILPIWMTASSR